MIRVCSPVRLPLDPEPESVQNMRLSPPPHAVLFVHSATLITCELLFAVASVPSTLIGELQKPTLRAQLELLRAPDAGRLSMVGRTVYEVSAPLQTSDVGRYASPYEN